MADLSQPTNNYAGSSLDLGLPAFPNMDEKKNPDVYGVIIKVQNAIRLLAQYVDLYLQPTIVAQASETILPGAMVNLYNDPTTNSLFARNAKAADATKPCQVFSLGNYYSGTQGEFQTLGVDQFIGELVPGTLYYLSPSTGGNITSTRPSTAGQLIQEVGVAISTTALLFRPAGTYKEL